MLVGLENPFDGTPSLRINADLDVEKMGMFGAGWWSTISRRALDQPNKAKAMHEPVRSRVGFSAKRGQNGGQILGPR